MIRGLITLALVGLVVLTLVGIGLFELKFPKTITNNSAETVLTPTITGMPSDEVNLLTVADTPAGDSVTLSRVVLDRPGFVVIGEDNNGVPGTVLGQSEILNIGEYQDLMVSLRRASERGEILYAQLYADDGNGAFDGETDMPISGDDGTPVMEVFSAGALLE